MDKTKLESGEISEIVRREEKRMGDVISPFPKLKRHRKNLHAIEPAFTDT